MVTLWISKAHPPRELQAVPAEVEDFGIVEQKYLQTRKMMNAEEYGHYPEKYCFLVNQQGWTFTRHSYF